MGPKKIFVMLASIVLFFTVVIITFTAGSIKETEGTTDKEANYKNYKDEGYVNINNISHEEENENTCKEIKKIELKKTRNAEKSNKGTTEIKPLPENLNVVYDSEVENEIIRLVNYLRKENGLSILKYDSLLQKSARYKSNSMIQLRYFGHPNPNYDNKGAAHLLFHIFKLDAAFAGENIAMKSDFHPEDLTAEVMFNLWMNSPPHKAAMLNPKYSRIGVGVAVTNTSNGLTKMYGTQHFAN